MGELGARAMVAHDLGGDWHNADTLADLNAKISDGTLVIQTGGSYTGDGTVNRAIPHGLGVVPKIVICFILGKNGIGYMAAMLTFSITLTGWTLV